MAKKSDSIANKRTEAIDQLLEVMEGFTPEQLSEIIASRQADKRKEKEQQEKKAKEIAAARADVQHAVESYCHMTDIELDIDWAFVWHYLKNKQSITFKPKEVDRDFWNWLWN